MNADIYRYLFEILLAGFVAVLTFYFKSVLSELREKTKENRNLIDELENSMTRDASALNSLAAAVRDHTNREQVYWDKIDALLYNNERQHADLRERLGKIEGKITNGHQK